MSPRDLKRFRRYCVRILNRDVFATIRFTDKREHDIVYDSYVQNLDNLIDYAMSNKIQLDRYIREIRMILLESRDVYEREH